METEDQNTGLRGWVDVEAVRHLLKHASANIVALLILALFAWLLHVLDKANLFPNHFATLFEWIDLSTMTVVFILFGVQTIKFFVRRMFNGSISLILA